ncbi:MAG TPA: CHAD domain-containing protein [Wenzhouxiangellaceae bacterium]|nr:CHAD domain-containing protein [Wenzhouxiangellaceae bacterium]
MSYRIEKGEPVSAAVRRIAKEQTAKALADLTIGPASASDDEIEEAIHDCRKRCKKLRGLLRLVRPVIGDRYKPGNVAFRDAARVLAPFRDAHAVLETFDHLEGWATGRDVNRRPLAAIREGLAADARAASKDVREQRDAIEHARHLIETGLARCMDAEFEADDWHAVGAGLKKTYRRGRKAMKAAAESRDPEDFHEWRKRCKYSWYHLRLIENCAPYILDPLTSGFHALSSTLGDAHDLAVLVERLDEAPDRYGGKDAVARVRVLAATARKDLERRADRGGLVLYAEPPARFVKRLERYWRTWRKRGPEPPLPELEDLSDR